MSLAPVPDKYTKQTGEHKIHDIMFSKKNERKKFLDDLKKFEAECTFDGTPFCRRCCRLDFMQNQEDFWNRKKPADIIGSSGEYSIENVRVPVDFKKYIGDTKFDLIRRVQNTLMTIVDGTKVPRLVYFDDYVCRDRGCRMSIEIRDLPEADVKKPVIPNKKK